jgi:CRISPR-associated endoribonuclease Cas6
MRFRLHLQPLSPQPELMWNYHYPLSAWLYGVIAKADESYARFLHENGYKTDNNKTFKHFTFSDLRARIQVQNNGFRILSPMVQWTVSFYVDKAAESFIIGLFKDQEIRLFNKQYDTTFVIQQVESLPGPVFGESIRLKAASAMVVAEKVNLVDQYLEPTHPEFEKLLTGGLKDKYLSLAGAEGKMINPDIASHSIGFRLLDVSKVKPRKVTVKEDKKEATEIKGYRDFEFELTGPKEVLEVGYYGGFGRYSSSGFGFCELVV